MKLLSVIIPVYNVQDYLERCVLSVVYQTYTELEIILVDDGSTDSSGKLCDELASKYNRIQVIHKLNGGLSDARNVGIAQAKGYYIAFLDSDDYIHPQMYEILIAQLEFHNADLAECETQKVYANAPYMPKVEVARIVTMEREDAILSGIDWKNFTAVVWNKVYKKELIQNLLFPVGRFHEDEFYTYKALYNANKLIHITAKLHYYQQRPGSIMSGEIDIRHVHAVDAFKERIDFFKDKNQVLYERSCVAIVDYIYSRMSYFINNKKLPKEGRLKLYNAYGVKFQELEKEVIHFYIHTKKISSKKANAIKLLYINPTLFRICYQIYKIF